MKDDLIKISNVTFGYKGAQEKLLNNIDLSIGEGQTVPHGY